MCLNIKNKTEVSLFFFGAFGFLFFAFSFMLYVFCFLFFKNILLNLLTTDRSVVIIKTALSAITAFLLIVKEAPKTMEKSNTRQEILQAALEMFSVQGYEATSVSQIAQAVGIQKASMYSHFSSKQEILDELVRVTLEQYNKRSIFARADWNDPEFVKDKQDMTCDTALQMILGQIRYILHDPAISKSRKMLTIEQFRNQELSALQTKQTYTDVMRYFTGFIRFLIRLGRLADNDPEIMAAQLCLPISIWINLCDREPDREGEVTNLIERHVRQFFGIYGVSEL